MGKLIIVDDRMPAEAKRKLSGMGKLILFSSSGITYEAISGHPDIFFCQTEVGLIAAPNTPPEIIRQLKVHGINPKRGILNVGKAYPDTARYNALVSGNFIIHNAGITDQSIKDLAVSLDFIDVAQGYTRCNLLALGNQHFITSDRSIEKALISRGFSVLYVSPAGIILNGYPNGFIGGCCGIIGSSVVVAGSLRHFDEGEKFNAFANQCGYRVIELYEGPLFDGGSILFLDS